MFRRRPVSRGSAPESFTVLIAASASWMRTEMFSHIW